jgi:hypothetical protein
MLVTLTNEAGDTARYTFTGQDGEEVACFGPYPPTSGDVVVLFRPWHEAGGKPQPYIPPSEPAGRTAKADIWRRATDAEASVIAQALDALPLRKRRIYDDATYLDHGDPMFAELWAGFVQAFGNARASELLAVSA